MRTKVLIVQSEQLGFDKATAFYERLDKTVVEFRKYRPVMRFKDKIAMQWASVRRKPYLERKAKTIEELMIGIGKVVTLFQAWEKDKDLQKIIEAAEDADIPVIILRANP